MGERSKSLGGNVKLLADAGAKLVTGTDSGLPGMFHGAALHRELQNLVALGLRPSRVLRMATVDAAHVIDPRADYGEVRPGQRADLLLIEGDPLADISATEKIAGVWQDGRKLDRLKR
jgi:imidazolonepropionase-like amidohydrolase